MKELQRRTLTFNHATDVPCNLYLTLELIKHHTILNAARAGDVQENRRRCPETMYAAVRERLDLNLYIDSYEDVAHRCVYEIYH